MDKAIKEAFISQNYEEAKKLLATKEDKESKVLLARIYNIQSEYQKGYELLRNLELDDEGYVQFMVSANGVYQYEDTIATYEKVQNKKQFDVLLSAIVAKLGLQEYEDAIFLLKEAEELDMKANVLAYYYYFAYTQMKQFELAYKYAKLAYELDANTFTLRNYMNAGLILQNYDDVLAAYTPELKAKEVDWLYFVALLQAENYEKAIAFGETLKQEYPDLYYVEDGLAQAYFHFENWEKTIENAKKYENEENEDLRIRSLNFLRVSYERLNDYEQANSYVQKLSTFEDANVALYVEAERLFEAGKYEEILALLQDIDTPVAMRQKAVVYYQLENYEEVSKLVRILLPMYQDIDLRKIAILSFLRVQAVEEAKNELFAMEKEKQDLAFVYSQLMNIYTIENNEEAIHYAYLGSELEQDKFEPQARLAQVYANFNKTEDAIKTLEKTLPLAIEVNQEGWIYKNLGILYFQTMQLEKAWEQFKNVDVFNPEEKWLAYHAGIVAMELQKYEEAIACFEFLYDQDDYGDDIVYRLALCYIETKQNNKFSRIYEECEILSENSEENAELFAIVRNRAFQPER